MDWKRIKMKLPSSNSHSDSIKYSSSLDLDKSDSLEKYGTNGLESWSIVSCGELDESEWWSLGLDGQTSVSEWWSIWLDDGVGLSLLRGQKSPTHSSLFNETLGGSLGRSTVKIYLNRSSKEGSPCSRNISWRKHSLRDLWEPNSHSCESVLVRESLIVLTLSETFTFSPESTLVRWLSFFG